MSGLAPPRSESPPRARRDLQPPTNAQEPGRCPALELTLVDEITESLIESLSTSNPPEWVALARMATPNDERYPACSSVTTSLLTRHQFLDFKLCGGRLFFLSERSSLVRKG
jgi:hypothetical protein